MMWSGAAQHSKVALSNAPQVILNQQSTNYFGSGDENVFYTIVWHSNCEDPLKSHFETKKPHGGAYQAGLDYTTLNTSVNVCYRRCVFFLDIPMVI